MSDPYNLLNFSVIYLFFNNVHLLPLSLTHFKCWWFSNVYLPLWNKAHTYNWDFWCWAKLVIFLLKKITCLVKAEKRGPKINKTFLRSYAQHHLALQVNTAGTYWILKNWTTVFIIFAWSQAKTLLGTTVLTALCDLFKISYWKYEWMSQICESRACSVNQQELTC